MGWCGIALTVLGLMGLAVAMTGSFLFSGPGYAYPPEEERNQLEAALSEVRTFSRLVPIWAPCKSIRSDQGFWTQIELYLQE